MSVYLVRVEVLVPVAAETVEAAKEIALAHVADEAENGAETTVEEIDSAQEIPKGFEDVIPWTSPWSEPLRERADERTLAQRLA